jgi:hypothetical protein
MKAFLSTLPIVTMMAGTAYAQPAASTSSSTGAIDFAHPMFIQEEPGAQCTIHPQGAQSPADSIDADPVSGKVRFFAPPSSWGTVLEADCSNKQYTKTYVVNLADVSTYTLDLEALQKPSISIRPALTGDPQTLTMEEILSGGYPPRPDAIRNPKAYQRWIETVSTPRPIAHIAFSTALGRAADNFKGDYDYNSYVEDGPAWTGRAMDVAGWQSISANSFTYLTEGSATYAPSGNIYPYLDYFMATYAPTSFYCPVGLSSASCYGFLWGGMGGLESESGISNGNLLQSGLEFQPADTSGDGNGYSAIFVEYFPGPILVGNSVGYFPFNQGEQIQTWGWTQDYGTNCPDFSGFPVTGNVACFNFYDNDSGTYFNDINGFAPKRTIPPGTYYYGWTYETIGERPLGAQWPNFGTDDFEDCAWVFPDYTYHDITTDPWVFLYGYGTNATMIGRAYNPSGLPDDYNAPYFLMDWEGYR